MACLNDGHSHASECSPPPRRFQAARWRKLVLIALLTAAVQPRIAGATVDMTGNWYVAIGDFGPVLSAQFTQTGMSLLVTIPSASATGTGTIDPMTGAFMVTLTFPPPDCGGTFSGVVDPGGNTFVAPGTVAFTDPDCQGGPMTCACMASAPADLRGSRAPCGNGTVDAGEQCDDGNTENGDCCNSTCHFEPNGAACNDHNTCTTGETCNAFGVCRGFTACQTTLTCDFCGSKCTLKAGVCKCGG